MLDKKEEKSIAEKMLSELRMIERNTNTIKVIAVIALIASAIAIISALLYPLTVPK